jgi:[lysine-biosynthesis-protein LysW]--L-2-aminoadipate ligase
MIIDAAKQNQIELKLFDTNRIPIEVTSDHGSNGFPDVILQRCISYFRSLHVTAALESLGVTVVNSFKATSICGNKLLASMRFREEKLPTPRTFVAFTEKSALEALEKLGYPAVLKPVVGSWGRLVALIKDEDSAKSIIESREYLHPIQQIYYLQERVKRPERDIRCYVIGDQVVAAIYRYSPVGDWRTNTALGGQAAKCPVTPELEELSVRAAKAMGGGAFGVDLMETQEGLTVHEVNHTTEFKNTVRVTGVNIPKLLLDYTFQQAKK